MSESVAGSTHVLDRHVRMTLQVALLVFVYVIGIGILNGLDLVEFSRQQLLSHLHGGTLGWMTLAIVGVSLWLFSDGPAPPGRSLTVARSVAILAAIAIPFYVLAFATTFGVGRPIAGVATLAALIGVTGWTYGRVRAVTLTVPHLLVLLGLTSSVIGGTFGVINGLAIALEWTWVPATFFEAHPGTMEIGFVMPVALGLAEWGLRVGEPPTRASRSGKIQAGLMFAAFAWVLGAILADADQLIGLGTLFAIVAIVIFFVRLRSEARTTSVTARRPQRHALAGGVLLAATIVYIFVIITRAQGDFAAVPRGQALGFIHLLAIGATTNALLAFVIHISGRGVEPNAADDVIFWGINLGLIGFVVALTADIGGLIHVFVPIMGLALLIAIAVHTVRLRRSRRVVSGVSP